MRDDGIIKPYWKTTYLQHLWCDGVRQVFDAATAKRMQCVCANKNLAQAYGRAGMVASANAYFCPTHRITYCQFVNCRGIDERLPAVLVES